MEEKELARQRVGGERSWQQRVLGDKSPERGNLVCSKELKVCQCNWNSASEKRDRTRDEVEKWADAKSHKP